MPTGNDVAARSVDVSNASGAADVPDDDQIRRWVEATLDAAAPDHGRPVEVAVRIVAQDEIHILNREYRQSDKPTNVLSFPTGTLAGLPKDEAVPLGDIVVCAGVVMNEAAEQGKAPADHWAHMLVHGTLHLLGFDHEEEVDAEAMEALEVRILAGLGVADPYESQTDTID